MKKYFGPFLGKWRLQSPGQGRISFRAVGNGVMIRVQPKLDESYPLYQLRFYHDLTLLFKKSNATSNLQVICKNKDGPKDYTSLNNYTTTFNSETETITASVNGRQILNCTDKNYSHSVQYFSFSGAEVEIYHITEGRENKTLPVPPKQVNNASNNDTVVNHTIITPVNNATNVTVDLNASHVVTGKTVSFKPAEVQELNVSDRRCMYDWDPQFKLPNLSYGKIVFSAYGDSQIGVGISPILGISPNMYKIMIGGANNASYISHEDHTVCISNNTNIPKNVLKNYTVIVNRLEKTIEVNQDGHEILFCHDNDFIDNVQYATFNKQNIKVYYSNYGTFALPEPSKVVPTIPLAPNVTVVTHTTVSNTSVVVTPTVKTTVVTPPPKTTVSVTTVVSKPAVKAESQDFSIPDS